jgi:hypothetical protein
LVRQLIFGSSDYFLLRNRTTPQWLSLERVLGHLIIVEARVVFFVFFVVSPAKKNARHSAKARECSASHVLLRILGASILKVHMY